MNWILALLPGIFLFIFGIRYYCDFFLAIIIISILCATFVSFYFRQKKSGFAKIVITVLFLGFVFWRVLYPYSFMADRCYNPGSRVIIAETMKALEIFKLDCGFYPSSEQGLKALIEPPKSGKSCNKWGPEQYIKRIPRDFWGKELMYELKDQPRVFSFGADQMPGGDGINKDLSSDDQ